MNSKIETSDRILLVIDLQHQFRDNDGRYELILDRVRNIIKNEEYSEVIGTNCINYKQSNWVRLGLWAGCINSMDKLEYTPDKVIYKHGYGLDSYKALDIDKEYDIVGFDTNACVLKIALDMFDRGYKFRVLSQYCYSQTGREKHEDGLRVLKATIGQALI